ncbi:MAG: hypothetical protein AAF449_03100 [Myxococcota bacterium]
MSIALLTFGVNTSASATPPPGGAIATLQGLIDGSPWGADFAAASWAMLGDRLVGVVAPGIDRVEVARAWSGIATEAGERGMTLDAGVAGYAIAPLDPDAEHLLEPARRCLAAAHQATGPTIKSIDVY